MRDSPYEVHHCWHRKNDGFLDPPGSHLEARENVPMARPNPAKPCVRRRRPVLSDGDGSMFSLRWRWGMMEWFFAPSPQHLSQ